MTKTRKRKTETTDSKIESMTRRLSELRDEKADLENKILQIQQRKDDVSEKAEQLLHTGKVTNEIDEQLEAMHGRRRIIDRAIAIGTRELQDLRSTKADEVSKAYEPKCKKVAGDMIKSLGEFQQAVSNWFDLMHELDSKGAPFGSRPAEMSDQHQFFRYFYDSNYGKNAKDLQSNVFLKWLSRNWT